MDKELPQDKRLESQVLGAFFLEPKTLSEVATIVSEDLFYNHTNKLIFRSVWGLFQSGNPFDYGSVINDLKVRKKEKQVDVMYLIGLTNDTISTSSAEYHVRILSQLNIRRECILIGLNLMTDGHDNSIDAITLMDNLEGRTVKLSSSIFSDDVQDMGTLYDKIEANNEKILSNPTGLSGLETGIQPLNRATGGWQNGELYVIAARPGMGKSALASWLMVRSAQKYKVHCGFMSYEMSYTQTMGRLISQITQIELTNVLHKGMQGQDFERFKSYEQEIKSMPLTIEMCHQHSLSGLKSRARTLKLEKNMGLMVLDFLQNMPSSGKSFSKADEVAKNIRGLKNLAVELDIPVIVLSQLNRNSENREGNTPRMSDMKESGTIEEVADGIILLNREDYHHKDDPDYIQNNEVELILDKSRNSWTGTTVINWNPKTLSFYP